MKKIILVGLFSILTSASAFAAIDCKPDMNNCGSNPSDGLTPPHAPHKPTVVDADGYFEVASPDCLEADMQTAKQGAEAKAFVDAKLSLGSSEIHQTAPARFLILRCEQSIYAGSFQGNSWIAYAVVKYSL